MDLTPEDAKLLRSAHENPSDEYVTRILQDRVGALSSTLSSGFNSLALIAAVFAVSILIAVLSASMDVAAGLLTIGLVLGFLIVRERSRHETAFRVLNAELEMRTQQQGKS